MSNKGSKRDATLDGKMLCRKGRTVQASQSLIGIDLTEFKVRHDVRLARCIANAQWRSG